MADKNYKLNFALSDGSTKSVQFTAPQGAPGSSGVHVGSSAPTDETTNVWIDPAGEASGTEQWEFTLADGSTVSKTVVVLS